MFGGKIGFWELLIILGILLLLFGATKLPQLARGLGRSISEFKKGLKEDLADNKDNKKESEDKNQ